MVGGGGGGVGGGGARVKWAVEWLGCFNVTLHFYFFRYQKIARLIETQFS